MRAGEFTMFAPRIIGISRSGSKINGVWNVGPSPSVILASISSLTVVVLLAVTMVLLHVCRLMLGGNALMNGFPMAENEAPESFKARTVDVWVPNRVRNLTVVGM